jgi:hypothetical protein
MVDLIGDPVAIAFFQTDHSLCLTALLRLIFWKRYQSKPRPTVFGNPGWRSWFNLPATSEWSVQAFLSNKLTESRYHCFFVAFWCRVNFHSLGVLGHQEREYKGAPPRAERKKVCANIFTNPSLTSVTAFLFYIYYVASSTHVPSTQSLWLENSSVHTFTVLPSQCL